MKEQAYPNSGDEANDKLKKDSGWGKNLLGSIVVGLIVITFQIFAQPIIARKVKIEESIAQRRYEACENALNLLQRRLAFVNITGSPVPEWYTPPEKTGPTQVEMNTAYSLLLIYGKTSEIAEQFYAVSGATKTNPSDIVKFIDAVRREIGVDKKSSIDTIHYIMNRPTEKNENSDIDQKLNEK